METIWGTDYSKEQFIDLLNNGECPFCGRKGYKVILMHIVRKHEINKKELLDELMLNRRHPFCSKEVSEKRSKTAVSIGLGTIINARKGRKGVQYDYVSRKKMKTARNQPHRKEQATEVFRRTMENQNIKQKSIEAVIASNKKRAKIPDSEYHSISERAKTETQASIAKDYQCHKSTIGYILKNKII